jgi:drug/metabolite transporter (DMT)-like permease
MSQTLPSNTTLVTLCSSLSTAILSNESWKLAIPAVLYTLQNTLQYVAVSNLDAATFQVTYQLKILTTAVFSVIMLGRVLSARKWMSLFLLIVGVSIIQVPQHLPASTTDSKAFPRTLEDIRRLSGMAAHKISRAEHAPEAPGMDRSVGLIAVLVACALSGLAGVTFEKILKDSSSAKNTTLWVRNCQLSFWSLFPSLFVGVLWKEGDAIAKTGFFAGYNWVVWMAILFQAAGGVIVALVINYADNIAKNFATSVSIVLSCVASAYFFDFKVTMSVCLLATHRSD